MPGACQTQSSPRKVGIVDVSHFAKCEPSSIHLPTLSAFIIIHHAFICGQPGSFTRRLQTQPERMIAWRSL
jgi:hypothetical protein